MHNKITKRRESGLLSRASVFALASAAAVAPQLGYAQQADDEIIVTGSRIPSTNASSTSPVTTIGNVEFDIRGTTRVEDLVNTLPQAFAAQGANTSNGATGTATVNLRGLGSVRTLVLVDGRRLQYGSSIAGASAPDLNQIPSALVERVDVLTGGASAVYGSDAIAGVVNFVMIDDFEGVRLDGQLSGYQHSNNDQVSQDILNRSGFGVPESGVFDGKGQEITLIVGANTEDGRGNVTAYAGYRNNDKITQDTRDYSRCQFGGGAFGAALPFGFGCSGSATNINGTFATPNGTWTLDENGPGNTFRPTDAFVNALSPDVFNFAPTNFYQRPDERYVLGAFGRYEINDHAEVYTQAMFYDYTSDAQIAFTGTFFTPTTINCDNPLISNTAGAAGYSQLDAICGSFDLNGAVIPGSGVNTGTATLYPGKRFVELGAGRNDHIRLTSYRIVAGVRGDIMEGWTYDTFFQYANTHNAQRYENDASITRMVRALDVIDVGGVPTCRSVVDGTDPACIPLNIFQIGGVTPAAVQYVSVPSFQDGDTFQYMGQANFTGDLGQYGVKSPWAEDGVGIAGGFEWRKDQLVYQPDALFQSGDLAGQGGTTPPVNASIETTDFYIEAQIPLVSGMAFAEALSFSGGYRHSNVSTSGSYSTWKLQGDWQVTPDIRVRGGWQRAARAANVLEAFRPQNTGLTALANVNGFSDPCAGATPNATATQCANTGVTAGQYGSITNNPAAQYNAVFGGNPNLRPEVSDTYTVGVVLTPEFVPGNLFVSVDYFDIKVEGFIAGPSADNIMQRCLSTGEALACSLITRAPNSGSLFLNTSGFFTLLNNNTGSLATSGLDINGNYSFDLGSAGGLSFDLVGTYLIDYLIEPEPGDAISACEGKYAGICDTFSGVPLPVWRHKLRTTWETPLGVDASLTWRYFGSVDQFGVANPDPSVNRNHTLGSRNYIDLAASYNLTEKWNVRVGVNNLLDKDPPLTAQQTGFTNGNTYPQTYDAQGRFLFIGTTIDF
ncbi:MAG: TonB-dependent receptor [Parvularculaceae bacterium]|nr:TonB-dependent receptor [Parvularculaceae bacterium]